MFHRYRFWVTLLITGLLLASLSSAWAAPQSGTSPLPTSADPKKGGELKVGMEVDMTGTDPHLEQTYSSLVVIEQVYEGLVKYDYKMNIVPCLAEKWDTPDPQTYTFHLRKGVKFHNGREVVADDVKYSLERIMDPKLGSPYANWLGAVKSIEAPDPSTVTIHLSRADAPLLATLAWRFLAVVPKEVVDEHKGRLDGVMVGTGPFVLKEWKPRDHVRLERNPNYWQAGLPYLDAITFLPIEDPTARTSALRTGTIDFNDAVAPQDIELFQSMKDITLFGRVAFAYNYIGMNCQKAPFDKVKVRQAVAWATDRQMYVDTVLFGKGEVITGGPIPDSNWAYANLKVYTAPDVKKARQLLAEAGYPDGFSVTIKTMSGYPDLMGAAQVAQQNLKEIGIKAEIKPLETGVFMDEAIGKRDYEIVTLGWGDFMEPNDYLYAEFHSGEPWNHVGYSNAQVDGLLEKARETSDQTTRTQLYKQIQQIIVDEAPYAFLAHSVLYQGYGKAVQGFQTMADGSKIAFMETWLDK